MRSRSVRSMSGASLVGLAIGVAAGAAAALLAAPMRGADMRASLRSRADEALDRGLKLFEEGRRAFRTRSDTPSASLPASASGAGLSATLGEIAQMHGGDALSPYEARS